MMHRVLSFVLKVLLLSVEVAPAVFASPLGRREINNPYEGFFRQWNSEAYWARLYHHLSPKEKTALAKRVNEDLSTTGPDGKLRVRQPAEVLMRYLRNQLLQSKDPMIDLEMRILEAEEKLQDISKDFCQAKPVADQCRFEIQGLEKEIAAAREKLAKARREDGANGRLELYVGGLEIKLERLRKEECTQRSTSDRCAVETAQVQHEIGMLRKRLAGMSKGDGKKAASPATGGGTDHKGEDASMAISTPMNERAGGGVLSSRLGAGPAADVHLASSSDVDPPPLTGQPYTFLQKAGSVIRGIGGAASGGMGAPLGMGNRAGRLAPLLALP